MSIQELRRICEPLEISVDLLPRGRGADLDRVVNARHTELHDAVARTLGPGHPDWEMAHEVSFNIRGERGVIDLLLWHPGRRALLIIELKTELADLGELLATQDRRRRLASAIVRERGWQPAVLATWVIVARSRTTERRIHDHHGLLRSAMPAGERDARAWLADPTQPISAMSLWRAPAGTTFAPTLRVRRAS